MDPFGHLVLRTRSLNRRAATPSEGLTTSTLYIGARRNVVLGSHRVFRNQFRSEQPMTRLHTILLAMIAAVAFTANAGAAGLALANGNFDSDPSLGGADDPVAAPTGWYTHYTMPQSWSDFRFGNTGNGSWNNNGIVFGQNFLGPNFDPGPEDGYFYTSLGIYGGEASLSLSGVGYNRINGNAAGGFDVSLYYSPGDVFVGADGSDVAASGVLLGTTFVDVSALTGTTAHSQAFNLSV